MQLLCKLQNIFLSTAMSTNRRKTYFRPRHYQVISTVLQLFLNKLIIYGKGSKIVQCVVIVRIIIVRRYLLKYLQDYW